MPKGLGSSKPQPSHRRTFTARFTSECPACGDDIDAGDEAIYDEFDEVVHAECLDDSQQRVRPQSKACQKCFQIHVGECL